MNFADWIQIVIMVTGVAAVIITLIKMGKKNDESVKTAIQEAVKKELDDYKQYAELKIEVERIKTKVEDIEEQTNKNGNWLTDIFEKIENRLESIHERINEHLKQFHSK